MGIATDYAALNGSTVTQAHTNYCKSNGHAMHTIDGADQGVCPRCGEVTVTVKAGTPATLLYPQDAYPYVVTRVSASGKTAWMERLVLVNATTGHEPAYSNGPFPVWNHTYTTEEVATMGSGSAEVRISERKDGSWRVAGSTTPVQVGRARYYRDFSW